MKALEAQAAGGANAEEAGSANGVAREMEFLRKERRAEVEQVDQEWRLRWEALRAECAQLQTQIDAAAHAAIRASEQHAKDVESVR